MQQEQQDNYQDRTADADAPKNTQGADKGNNKQRRDDEEDRDNIYLNSTTTLQTPEEHQHDQSIDPRKENRMSVSGDDLRETKGDHLGGSDRAGTAERKP